MDQLNKNQIIGGTKWRAADNRSLQFGSGRQLYRASTAERQPNPPLTSLWNGDTLDSIRLVSGQPVGQVPALACDAG